MFNLDQAISEWRRHMAAGGIKSPKVLDELESHLREDAERRMQSGAAPERAFQEAARKIGAAQDLKLEFGKITLPQPQLSRTALRLGCAGMAVFVFLVEGWTLLRSDSSAFVGPTKHFAAGANPRHLGTLSNLFNPALMEPPRFTTGIDRILGLVIVFLIACYIGFLPDLNRLQSGVRGWALRKAVAITCNFMVFLWTGLLLLSIPPFALVHLPAEIVFNVVCWSLYVAAAATVVVIAHGTEPEALKLWTIEAWQSFEMAEVEASRFHHDFIGTEHVLLGLLGAENSVVPKVLRSMGVSRETVRGEIETVVGYGPHSQTNRPPPYTPRAKRAIKLAILEARSLQRDRVDAEHLFLGLIREGGGVAAKVLSDLGISAIKAREEILKELGRRNDLRD